MSKIGHNFSHKNSRIKNNIQQFHVVKKYSGLVYYLLNIKLDFEPPPNTYERKGSLFHSNTPNLCQGSLQVNTPL
jgi:hypothetical protein